MPQDENEFICPFSLNREEPLYCNEGFTATYNQDFLATRRCRAWKILSVPVYGKNGLECNKSIGYCKLIEGKQK